MRSPYDILGVKPTASEDDIRKAFRALAKRWHPDIKPGDAKAEARFKEINAAYDLLSDPAKRARFDRGEIDAEGHETFAHAHAARGANPAGQAAYGFRFGQTPDDMSDLFAHLFGERFASGGESRRRGRDVRQTVTIDFADAALGARRRLSLPDGRSLEVTIPEGVKDGQVLRLKGQGAPGSGGEPSGDLLLEMRVAPHRLFRRIDDDLHLDLPVSLGEAVEGARITVPTLSGKVALKVPPGSNTGTVLRLKGKGVKGGDLYVTLKVTLPPVIDEELAAFVKEWSGRHPYDPRRGN